MARSWHSLVAGVGWGSSAAHDFKGEEVESESKKGN